MAGLHQVPDGQYELGASSRKYSAPTPSICRSLSTVVHGSKIEAGLGHGGISKRQTEGVLLPLFWQW